jgi:hypothetical protein
MCGEVCPPKLRTVLLDFARFRERVFILAHEFCTRDVGVHPGTRNSTFLNQPPHATVTPHASRHRHSHARCPGCTWTCASAASLQYPPFSSPRRKLTRPLVLCVLSCVRVLICYSIRERGREHVCNWVCDVRLTRRASRGGRMGVLLGRVLRPCGWR